MKRYCLFVVGIFLFPLAVSASVHVSEIAWMGTKDSSSHEWIELYNDGGDATPLAGWKLESEGGSFSIALKGSIDTGGYYLIKRTSDFSEVGAPADLVASFGSGLKNSGDTLRLIDAASNEQDQVTGGSDWKSIGGNNDTKETAQWTSSGWVTAAPTPRSAAQDGGAAATTDSSNGVGKDSVTQNSSSNSSGNTSDDASSRTTASKESSGLLAKVTPTKVSISGPSDAAVRTDAVFAALVAGTDQRYDSAQITWNFGDGTTVRGQSVSHRYSASASAVVIASVTVGGQEFIAQKNVTIHDVNVSITAAQDGVDGFVRFTSKQSIDVGGWVLRDGLQSFVFPAHSMLASGASVAISNNTLGMLVHVTPALFDSSGRLVSAYGDREVETAQSFDNTRPAISQAARQVPLGAISERGSELKDAERIATMTLRDTLSDPRSHLAQSSFAGGLGRAPVWPYWFALTAIIAISCAVAYYASRRLDPNQIADDEAAKYTILEIDSNLHN